MYVCCKKKSDRKIPYFCQVTNFLLCEKSHGGGVPSVILLHLG